MLLLILVFLVPVIGNLQLECEKVQNSCLPRQVQLTCTSNVSSIGWKITNSNSSFCFVTFSMSSRKVEKTATGACNAKAVIERSNVSTNVTSTISFTVTNSIDSITCFRPGFFDSYNSITCKISLSRAPSAPYNLTTSSCMPFELQWSLNQSNVIRYIVKVTGVTIAFVQYYRTNTSHSMLDALSVGEVYIATVKAVNHCNQMSNSSESVVINTNANVSPSDIHNITVDFINRMAIIRWYWHQNLTCPFCFYVSLNNDICGNCIQGNSYTTLPLKPNRIYFIQIAAHYNTSRPTNNLIWSRPVCFICAPQLHPSINYTVDGDTLIVHVIKNNVCEKFINGCICPPSTAIVIELLGKEEMKFPSTNDIIRVQLPAFNISGIIGSVSVENECGQSSPYYLHNFANDIKPGASLLIVTVMILITF